jgi:TolB-like protein/Tfp pilus assembly protein PilF
MSFFNELKRRNVFRVGIAYAIAAWIILQVTDVIGEIMELPEWGGKLILLMVAVGFPLALIFAWAFELTPEGIKRERDVDRSHSITPQTGRRLDRMIIGVLVLALGYFMLDKFALEPRRDGSAIQQVEVQPATQAAAPKPEPAAAVTAPDERKSIVVLPFVNMSADPEQEYFSDGLSEELLNVLAKIEELRVISRTSAFAFKGKEVSIPEIARQLDVAYVLEGSVRSAGDQVRITAQLIEVANDSHLWSDAYNRKLENVFEIQEEISQAIARELQVELGTTTAAGRPTENLEAYQLLLRGRHHYQARGEENMRLAVDALQKATELDPAYADAWANLAAASLVLSFYLAEDFEAPRVKAEQAARRAIELDPGNGFAHAVLGLYLDGQYDYEGALRAFERAIELNPSESNSYLWMGITLCQLGFAERALAYFGQAERFDPVFTNLQNWMANAYALTGDLEGLQRHEERQRQLDPSFEGNVRGAVGFLQGDIEAAYQAQLADAAATGGDPAAIEAMFAALRNPAERPDSIKALLEINEGSNRFNGVFAELLAIGAVEEAAEQWRIMRDSGRGLRAVNALTSLWLPWIRQQLNHPAAVALLEDSGVAAYWRSHEAPGFCTRQPDNSFLCGEP